jgi:protein TonB
MTLRRFSAIALVGALAAATAGCTDMRLGRGDPPATPNVVTDPQWAKKPTDAEIQALFPAEAKRMQVNGQAVLQCVIQQEGGLRPCSVVSETPAKMGFGDAALKAAPMFQVATATKDSRAVRGASVTFPVVFTASTASPPA